MPVPASFRLLCAGLLALLPAAGWSAAPAWSQDTQVPSAKASSAKVPASLQSAADALQRGDWNGFDAARSRVEDDSARALLDWLELDIRGEEAGLAALQRFLGGEAARNRWFPGIAQLRRQAERALAQSEPTAQQVLAHFGDHPPASGIGAQLLGEALLATGRQGDGAAALRQAWREHVVFHSSARDFRRRHGALLTEDDHRTRMEALLWREEAAAARAMLPLLPAGERALATARLRLMTRSAGVDAAVQAVPEHLRQDEGLVYERVRWRRRHGLEDSAMALLLQAPPATRHQGKWWRERHILARHALRQGRHAAAYRIAGAHGMESGLGFAEGEFLAGWLALRRLGEPERAYRHFRRLLAGVTTPVSLARAGYWLGRAAEATSGAAAAQPHWREAAGFALTYYGQLAQAMLPGQEVGQTAVSSPAGGAAFVRDANAAEGGSAEGVSGGGSGGLDGFVRIVELAYGIGRGKLGEEMLLARARRAETEAEFVRLAQAAQRLGQKHIALRIAKRAARRHVFLMDALYPVDAFPLHALMPADRLVEPALLLAIARQESEFDPQAVSGAGARGMMQLLPSTARHVARGNGLKYDKAALLLDVGGNVRLGELYLAEMIGRFDGSYILAIAAYNAGPARVAGWLRQRCDPRRAGCDEIDWVEAIPIGETRNYVQRVLENLQNYRRILGHGDGGDVRSDLRRGAEDNRAYLPLRPVRVP